MSLNFHLRGSLLKGHAFLQGASFALCALLVFTPSSRLAAQPNPAAKADIYANFVGTWAGSEEIMENGVRVTHRVRIEISESKKRDALRLAYTFGEKGSKDFVEPVKTLKFCKKSHN